MELHFAPKGVVQIDNARICFRNFRGEGSMYNAEGNRNFSVVIPNQEIADELMNDKNRFGVGWNVKIKEPREEGGDPFMHLQVKVKFNERGPIVYLKTGDRMNKLDESMIHILDEIDISSVDLDIRPYDDEGRFGPFRSAYLQSMCVTQEIDRFAARFAEEEYPEE